MKRPRKPKVLVCVLLLIAADLSLRTIGFRRTVRAARRLSHRPAAQARPDFESELLKPVLTATAIYPGKSQCLEQAIVSWFLLRRRGYDARLRLGVQPFPFCAHAWVEMQGAPVTESPEVVANFVALPEVAS